jgi:hypothetical protein
MNGGCRILSGEGYEVTAVNGSDRALHHLNLESFDLAILDIEMMMLAGYRLAILERFQEFELAFLIYRPPEGRRNGTIKTHSFLFRCGNIDVPNVAPMIYIYIYIGSSNFPERQRNTL